MKKILNNKLPTLVITDIDGVWTDGGMYYDQTGNELKQFNTSDSAGVNFCKALKIPIAIITGEDTDIVKNRAKKLNIDFLFQGAKNKVEIAEKLISNLNITWEDVAFMGDDIGDYKLLKKVGISCAPNNASHYIKGIVDIVTKKNGGDGAFREFIEILIGEKGITVLLEKLS